MQKTAEISPKTVSSITITGQLNRKPLNKNGQSAIGNPQSPITMTHILGSRFLKRSTGISAGIGTANLIAFWAGNEASGDLLDLHTNALHLTDTNTVTNNTGLVYTTARQFTSANQEYFTIPDNALLRGGDVDLTVAGWIYLDSKTKAGTIASRYNRTGSGTCGYVLRYQPSSDRFRWYLGDGTRSSASAVNAESLGSPSLATWYLVIAWHDATAHTSSIQVNNGPVDTADDDATPADGAVALEIGRFESDPAVYDYTAARIGPVMIWKSAAGQGGVLSTEQRAALYNNGQGVPYALL
jgi:hypothetical protein